MVLFGVATSLPALPAEAAKPGTTASASGKVGGSMAAVRLTEPNMGREVLSSDVSLLHVEQSITVSQDKLATGYGSYLALESRHKAGVGTYRVRLRATSDFRLRLSASRTTAGSEYLVGGVEPIVSGLSAAKGTSYQLRVRVTGTSPTLLQARVWQLGTAEPSTWTLSVTDSTPELQSAGTVGVFAYVAGDATNVPITYRVEGWQPVAIDPPTAVPSPSPAPVIETSPAPVVETSPAPAPAPVVETSPAPAPAPAPTAPSPTAAAVGSAPVGSTNYPVPAGAVMVSPTGNDSAAGTLEQPLRTLARALQVVPAGGTVVLRKGSYHESVETPYGKRVTIQSYPAEAVWLDGSRRVDNFVQDGSAWRKDGWTVALDSTDPTAGAGDYWRFVDPAYPMAAYPDMVWVDDQQLKQVGSLAEMRPGTFFVDRASSRLYVGSDPNGRRVDAAALGGGLYVNKGAGSVVRGIGLRRFGTALREYGTLKAFADNVLVENVVVQDTAARAVGVDAAGVTLRHVTVSGAGQLGIGAHHADRMQILDSLVTGNNTEHFAQAPEAGGIKITSSRDDLIRGTTVAGNLGNAVWVDNSSLRITVVNNRIVSNTGHGIFYEISGAAVIADNLVQGNGENGLHLVESNDVQVYNNSLVRNGGRAIEVWESDRDAVQQTSWYIDSRYPNQPGVLWNARNVTVRNNAMVAQDGKGVSILGVDDSTRSTRASAMVTTDYNGWFRAVVAGPQWVTNWCDYGTDKAMRVFTDLASYVSTTGQDRNGFLVEGTAPEGRFRDAAQGDWRLADTGRTGAGLPADVAAAVGLPVGTVLPVGKITA